MRSRREILGALGGAAAVSSWAGSYSCSAIAQSSQRPRRLIFVHGRRQQRYRQEALKSKWLEALRKGAQNAAREFPQDVEIYLPYYGDKLDQLVPGRLPTRHSDQEVDVEPQPDEPGKDAFLRTIIEEVARRKFQTDKERRSLQTIIREIDNHAPGMSGGTIREFIRDVYAYIARPGIQDEIDGVVAQAFSEQSAVVVGHSLGSVVAYQILRSDHRALTVPLFVTLGSPLGIRAIRERFLPLKLPTSIGKWFNARDNEDYVALNLLDEKNFDVTPTIENYDGVKHETADHHDVVGYLNDPRVATRILDAFAD